MATRWVRWLKLPTRQVLIPWRQLAGLHHERRWLRDRITLRARHWEALLALPFVSGDHWELVPLFGSSADHRALRRLLSESAYRLALVDAASIRWNWRLSNLRRDGYRLAGVGIDEAADLILVQSQMGGEVPTD